MRHRTQGGGEENVEDATPGNHPANSTSASEVTSRIVYGLLLSTIAVALLWAGVVPFAVLAAAVSLAMSWEWGRLVRGRDRDLALYIHCAAGAAAVGLSAVGYAALGGAVLAIGAIIVFLHEFGGRSVLSALGVLYTGVPAAALIWLRSDEPWGFYAVLFIFAVAWVTDVIAYAAGRLIGGPKLAPEISPNKTWSGFVAALLASAGAGFLMSQWLALPQSYVVVAALLLSVVAQLGDLAESGLKRRFEIKNASELIPGHGGFLDRMDSTVAVTVAACLLAFLIDPGSPARALLFF